MVKIQIEADDELDTLIDVYRATNRLDSKSKAVEVILTEFFKKEKKK